LDEKIDKLLNNKDVSNSFVETVKQKAEKKLEEKKDKFSKELREKADKKIPFIG